MSEFYDKNSGLDESRAAEALRTAARAVEHGDYELALKLALQVASSIADRQLDVAEGS